MNTRDAKQLAIAMLGGFKGAIEVADFKRFLLLSFSSSGGPASMLSMLGMGERSSLSLSYDPLRRFYFHKILGGNQEMSTVLLYHARDPVMQDFLSNEPASIMKPFMSPAEMELLGVGTKKKKLVQVNASDFQLIEGMHTSNGKTLRLEIDMVFADLEGFVAGFDTRSRAFLVQGEQADLLFDVNFTPLTRKDDTNLITFDVYIDESKEIRNHAYIAMDQKAKLTFVDEIKDTNVQNILYCLIVPVKSFAVPA